ncbi:hypothetical protein CDL60_18305 [Roseateles noduli]|nr:hypothetical protein CDL60_18305 [Roseateles noduli]
MSHPLPVVPLPSHGLIAASGYSSGPPTESDMPRPPRDFARSDAAANAAPLPPPTVLHLTDILDLLMNERDGMARALVQMHALVRQVGWPTGVEIHAWFRDASRPNVVAPFSPMTGQDPLTLLVRQLDGPYWHYLPGRGDLTVVRSSTEPFLSAVLTALADQLGDAAWWTLGRLASDTRQRRFLRPDDPYLLRRVNLNLAQSYEMNCWTQMPPIPYLGRPSSRGSPLFTPCGLPTPPQAQAIAPEARSEAADPFPACSPSSDHEAAPRKRKRSGTPDTALSLRSLACPTPQRARRSRSSSLGDGPSVHDPSEAELAGLSAG